ncbi:MAG: cytochrome P460 family protein [Nitrospira sp.]|nr:cytochrome P460 family protein [Nitrospira sp.]MCP9442289.1 cytochrome P460 family protein [Nitrospira sp.]
MAKRYLCVTRSLWIGLSVAVMVGGCADLAVSPSASGSRLLKDGEVPFPTGYQSWPKFLSSVQRPDVKQVRELFINQVGSKAVKGQPFPHGTVMVMELHKVKLEGERPVTGTDGRLIKDGLAKIFVMAKGAGWGQEVHESFKTGEWVFGVFSPDGKPLVEEFNNCRVCHKPLADKDFVHRYDEYFEKRAGGSSLDTPSSGSAHG